MRYDVRCKMYVRARDVGCTKYEDAVYDACDVVRAARAVRWAMYDGGGVLRARLRRDRATGRPGAGNRSFAPVHRNALEDFSSAFHFLQGGRVICWGERV